MANATEKTVKVTKAQVLEIVKFNVENFDFTGTEVTAEDVIAYVDTTLAQMAAKNAKAAEKRAEKKAANDELKNIVAGLLTAEAQTGEDILAQIEDEEVTKGKIVSRMKALIEEGVAEKVKIKVDKRDVVAYKLK